MEAEEVCSKVVTVICDERGLVKLSLSARAGQRYLMQLLGSTEVGSGLPHSEA